MKITLGRQLKELRRENGLTQKEVAQQLHISAVTYMRYEKEQREPSLQLLADIAAFYDVSVDYLLGLDD
ncbi:MAG: helix-turn-helix domain-containing protein [Clostridia bacterium]|nr:helix-turn-helix domain-containing protein [Clostridia bacterium]